MQGTYWSLGAQAAHLLLHDNALSQFPGSREGMAIKEEARAGKVEPFGRAGRLLSPAGDILQQHLYPPSPELGFVSNLGCCPHALIAGGFYLK